MDQTADPTVAVEGHAKEDDPFASWLSELPKWLQTAAADVLNEQRLPDAADVAALADLCVAEVIGGSSAFATVPIGAFGTSSSGVRTRLRRISNVTGVNALDPTAALDFSDADLVVVYGQNGTGKSGFARITKHAAGVRARSAILPNVFATSTATPGAEFVFERQGTEQKIRWDGRNGPVDELKHLHVFDTEVARFYMTEKAEATYEPRRLRFLTFLVDVCDLVKAELQRRKDALPTPLPTIPHELAATALAGFVRDLGAKTNVEAVKEKLTLTGLQAERSTALREALSAPDHAVRLQEIARSLNGLQSLANSLEPLRSALSKGHIEKVAAAGAASVSARDAANLAAVSTFGHALLPGVGEGAWQKLWEAARTYATTVAYAGHPFPHVENARCPLCQQDLSEDAGARLQRFENFVRGEVEEKARSAEEIHSALLNALPSLPSSQDWLGRFAALERTEGPPTTLFASASRALLALRTAVAASEVPPVDFAPVLTLVEQGRATLEQERTLVESARDAAGRARLEAELLDLRMLEWSTDNLTAILAELERRKRIATIDAAIKTANTAALTKKKNELAQDELTGGYQQRFSQELRALGAARLRVKPVEAAKAKGQVKFSLAVDGAVTTAASPADVLSEGEARIVALAAFLADVSVADARTPFLFDDPISSLDIEFEERVVARLFELARTRQVLVFTHRLSFLTLLQEMADKHLEEAKSKGMPPDVHFNRIRLARLGRRVGLSSGVSEKEMAVHEAAGQISSTRLNAAKAYFDAGRVADYEQAMKGICSDLRITTERAVEEVLLNKVVVRFRRSVTTQNRLPQLAKISESDCIFLDDLMTRLSVFEHSQSEESPSQIPDLDEIRRDAERLRDWALEFRKRKLPTALVATTLE